MKNYEFLFELTSSLSKAEKRYFKLYSSLQTGDKNYLKVFDEVENQSTYNEAKIKAKFKGNKMINNFSVTKAYIIDQILKSLRNFNTKGSIDVQLQNELLNIEILYQKGIIPLAYKHLKKALKLATEHEKFGHVISILNWERTMSQISDFPPRSEKEIALEEFEVIAKQKVMIEYQSIRNKINNFKKKYGAIKTEKELDEFNQITNSPLLEDFSLANSNRAQFYFHMINAIRYSFLGDHELAYQHATETLKNNHKAIGEMEYLDGFLNYISVASFSGKIEEAVNTYLATQGKLKEMTIGQFRPVKNQLFYYESNYMLLNLLYLKRVDEAKVFLANAEKGLLSFGDKLSTEHKMVILDVLFFAYFSMGNFRSALQQINILMNDYGPQLRSDVVYGSKIYNLIIHFEMGNHDLLTYLLASAKRFFNKHSQYPEFEKDLLAFLKKQIVTTDKEELKANYEEFHGNVQEHLNRSKKKYQDGIEIHFTMMWLASKIQNKLMYECFDDIPQSETTPLNIIN